MKKILFLDRDGTLILEPEDYQIDSLEKLEFYPGVFQWLSKIVRELDYELVMVSNQDGLGTPSFPEADFIKVQEKVLKAFENEGIVFSNIHIDPSFPEENSPNRKPRTGMLQQYIYGQYNLKESVVIGDRLTDVELAKNLGSLSILLGEKTFFEATLCTNKWSDIYTFLKGESRKASVRRTTKETDIQINLNLNGSGIAQIKTGLSFFDHMLEQIPRHGLIDLEIIAKGDLEIDEHHTIEDVGITLGEAFAQALGSKKGIERYGFCLPMDDCLAQVSLDFGGRPWLVWEADFKREKVGDVPTELFSHFFKSFSDAAKCNLNMKAEGANEHHKIEALFKAFAKAIKMAVLQDERFILPSTKGTL
jgi:imidazoleglycerol-phosphate dehydratase / histidinol-phosphatase